MAIFLCFFWLLLLYVDTYIRSKDKDLFSPLRFVTLRFICQELPFVLYIALFPDKFLKNVLSVCNTDVQQAFVHFTFVQTVAYICLTVGINLFDRDYKFLKKAERATSGVFAKLSSIRVLYVSFFFIAVLTYFVFLYKTGGLTYLLSHVNDKNRSQLRVNQYYLLLFNLFYISPLLCMKAIKQGGKAFDKWFLAFQVIITLILQNTTGGRTSTVILTASLIVGYHYLIKPIQVNKYLFRRIAPGIFVFVIYMLAVPFLRSGKDMSQLKGYASVRTYMYQTSYVYIDVFSSNYFNFDNAWWFSGFFDPVKALGASKDKKRDIPQVDQGVYFKSIALRKQYYKPPTPRKELMVTSWPTENFGFAYANLLLPGTIIFFFLQGAFFAIMYRCMRAFNNPVVLSFYVIFILYFNFSSLRIADFIKITWLFCLLAFLYHTFIYRKLTSK